MERVKRVKRAKSRVAALGFAGHFLVKWQRDKITAAVFDEHEQEMSIHYIRRRVSGTYVLLVCYCSLLCKTHIQQRYHPSTPTIQPHALPCRTLRYFFLKAARTRMKTFSILYCNLGRTITRDSRKSDTRGKGKEKVGRRALFQPWAQYSLSRTVCTVQPKLPLLASGPHNPTLVKRPRTQPRQKYYSILLPLCSHQSRASHHYDHSNTITPIRLLHSI